MNNFDLTKYLAEGKLLKENTEEEINRVKNIIEKNYNSLISQYVSEGYDENELKMYYDYLLNPNSMGDMGKLEWLRSYSIESSFPSHQTPISERSDNNILEELSPVGRLRRKKGAAKSNDPSFIKAKRGLKQIFQQMLSGELSGKEANDQISDFTFGQGSMGVYSDTNTLFLRQFGMGGGDFIDYIIGKFENGGFTPAPQPKSKTALKLWNYLSKYLAEGRLFESEEDQFGAELDAFADQLASEIKDELEDHKEDIQKSDKELNEIAGVVGIIGYILLSNTVANMLSKFAKKQFAKRDFGKGEAAAKKIYDFTHKNEEAFKAPIKRIVSLFTKDAKKQKMISDILFAIVVLAMAGQAGGNAVSYIKKAGYLKGGLYGLKAAIKGTEVSNIIKNVVQDAVS